MSDTPRTDVLLIAHDMSPEPNIIIKHAQELERELNEANARIKRLEKAGDGLTIWVSPAYATDPSNAALNRWIKAKEAKP